MAAVGPFDNVEDAGWDVAYPPETAVDLAAEYPGQKGPVKWISHATSDDYGLVDLTKALDKHKGAVTYAYAEFIADKAQPCELRLTSPNANKVWLNGELLAANHVYHANDPLDQYIARGTLRKGPNAILLKVCQNEQEEDWAQKWEFRAARLRPHWHRDLGGGSAEGGFRVRGSGFRKVNRSQTSNTKHSNTKHHGQLEPLFAHPLLPFPFPASRRLAAVPRQR